ncbi:MAG: FAD-dependent oxidoreductase [Candidatus Lokiarchaeota archaeon]|nr:FAD-dependent oxidoreductase [Candidatus Lokiarchaeota archaeon]
MIDDDYDIVIIGSGLGGLTAASFLSRKGFKTLVVESRSRIGGRFSTFEYEGFKLPTGAILIPDGWVVKLLEEMGIRTDNLRPITRVYYRIDGERYEIPSEIGVPKALDIIDKLERKDAEEKKRPTKPVELSKIMRGYYKKMRGINQEEIITVRDWLLQYTENEKVHDAFDTLCTGLMMAHSWELPVSKFFLFQEMTKFYISPDGNLSIAQELARIVEKTGAVWTNSPARKIIIKEGKATSVIVEKAGKQIEIKCKMVISNTGAKSTVSLAGKENFDNEYLEKMRIKLRPSPCLQVLVASDKPLCLEGIHDGLEIIMGSRRIKTIIPISNICPELVPPGQHLIYTSAKSESTLHPMDIKYEMQQVKSDIREFFPDFEKHGRILKMRACGIINEWPEGRTWLGYGMPLETPISNLFNVGDSCIAPGLIGTPGSVESGYRVVDIVEKVL